VFIVKFPFIVVINVATSLLNKDEYKTENKGDCSSYFSESVTTE